MDLCPYSGQPCQNRKTTHITELKPDGSFTELHLCKDCSTKYINMAPETVKQEAVPVQAPAPPAASAPLLSGFLATLLGAMLTKAIMQQPQQIQPSKPKNAGKPPCPSCGMTLRELAKDGKTGCPTCWDHFKEELKIVTQHSHAGATKHVGKSPKVNKDALTQQQQLAEQNASIEERIKSYKLKMVKAIEIENYEAAGALKKQIADLQAQLTGVLPPTPPSSGGQ